MAHLANAVINTVTVSKGIGALIGGKSYHLKTAIRSADLHSNVRNVRCGLFIMADCTIITLVIAVGRTDPGQQDYVSGDKDSV
jgi:hypothetical protein